MIYVDPASSEFAALPRREQAKVYASLGWDKESLLDEFDVTVETLRRWLSPEVAARVRETNLRYSRSERRKEMQKAWRQSPAGRAWVERRRQRRAALRQAQGE